MQNKVKVIALTITLLFLTGCSTYTTFYSETYKKVENTNPKKIHRLDFSYQNRKEIPAKVPHLTKLKMINLSGNTKLNLTNFFDAIAHPENVEVLILDRLQLKKLPASIQKFKNLKHLSINGNPELMWSDTFSKIKNLPIQFLNLQHNKLNSLPAEISQITTLKDLNLSHNTLSNGNTFIQVAKLPKLYSLWLSYNNLEQVAPEIGLLKQVKNLYIGNNKLKELPIEMAGMKAVWVIQAEHNLFTSVPEVFIKMPSLFSAHLNNCQISNISETFATQKYSMKGLLLDNNNLSPSLKKRWKKQWDNFFLLSIE